LKRSHRTRRFSIDHGARSDPAWLFAFDMLEMHHADVRKLSLLDRKEMLGDMLAEAGAVRIRYTGHIEDGLALFKVATQLRLEGVVGKRANAPYTRGRSSDWVKIKTAHGRLVDAGRAKWKEQ
jgi:ATP-dependent DNA ligase